MARSPDWKIYTKEGEYVAACKFIEDAACLVGAMYDGGTIRFGHRKTVWTDGIDGDTSDSYDRVAKVAMSRARELYDHPATTI